MTVTKLPDIMTAEESALVHALGWCWNNYLDLAVLPPGERDDLNDFRRAIHDAQRIVMARAAKRQLNAIYGNDNEVKP